MLSLSQLSSYNSIHVRMISSRPDWVQTLDQTQRTITEWPDLVLSQDQVTCHGVRRRDHSLAGLGVYPE